MHAPTFNSPNRSVHTPSLSKRLWGLEWERVLPWSFDGITVEPARFSDALAFMQEHYPRIFGTADERFLADPMTPAKKRFGEEMDVFTFLDCGAVVGVLAGHPSDWSTYYMRTVALLPNYRERRLLTRFVEASYEPLRAAGVERIEGDCSVANVPMLRMMTTQGFLITSTANSERWGATVRLSKFLQAEAKEVFLRQFCSVSNNLEIASRNQERRTP